MLWVCIRGDATFEPGKGSAMRRRLLGLLGGVGLLVGSGLPAWAAPTSSDAVAITWGDSATGGTVTADETTTTGTWAKTTAVSCAGAAGERVETWTGSGASGLALDRQLRSGNLEVLTFSAVYTVLECGVSQSWSIVTSLTFVIDGVGHADHDRVNGNRVVTRAGATSAPTGGPASVVMTRTFS
jgi:hypothetical protein